MVKTRSHRVKSRVSKLIMRYKRVREVHLSNNNNNNKNTHTNAGMGEQSRGDHWTR